MTDEKISELCKALGDPNRLKIIKMLSKGELCACRLLEAFNITQPTLSHHMKILSAVELVDSRREGKWTYYSINKDSIRKFNNYVEAICCPNGRKTKSCCSGR